MIETQMILHYFDPFFLGIAVFSTCCCGIMYLFYPAIVTTSEALAPVQAQDLRTGSSQKKSLTNPPVLTLVIPAFDEEQRLRTMLQEAYSYLCQPHCPALAHLGGGGTVEWIVVNDGSSDRTSSVYKSFTTSSEVSSECNMSFKLIEFPRNCGKGAAVQAGMLAGTGTYLLMVDADGATDFAKGLEAVSKAAMSDTKNDCVVLGSRAQFHETSGAKRSFLRSLLTSVFHLCVVIFVGSSNIRDTQCGFKLFPQPVAHHLFRQLHLRRWAFDTELIFLATQLKYKIHEVVVPWQEIEGSKLHTSALNLALVSVSMLRDMVCVRLCYVFGLWKVHQKDL